MQPDAIGAKVIGQGDPDQQRLGRAQVSLTALDSKRYGAEIRRES